MAIDQLTAARLPHSSRVTSYTILAQHGHRDQLSTLKLMADGSDGPNIDRYHDLGPFSILYITFRINVLAHRYTQSDITRSSFWR